MPNTVKVRLLHPDHVNTWGSPYNAPYNWAVDMIKKGYAELVREEPTKPTELVAPQNPNIQKTAPIQKPRSIPYDVCWVQDNNIKGGAELSGEHVINIGSSLGFSIYTLTPQNFNLQILRHSKIIILNNIFTFSNTQMVEIKRAIFEFERPYIKYEHDMRESYKERLSLSRRLFKHSKCNFFISPAHLGWYQEKIYDMSPSYMLPLSIDTSLFKPVPNIKRDKNKVVCVANLLRFKGWLSVNKAIKDNPDKLFDVYTSDKGIATNLIKNRNCQIKKRVLNKEMPRVYSEAGYIIHLPTEPWAGERVVFEASLCGCKIMANDYVGHMSWKYDLKNRASLSKKLKEAPFEFWRVVGGVI